MLVVLHSGRLKEATGVWMAFGEVILKISSQYFFLQLNDFNYFSSLKINFSLSKCHSLLASEPL